MIKKRNYFCICIVLSFLLIAISQPVFAEISAGNYISESEGENSTDVIKGEIERDAYSFSYAINVNESTIGRSFISASYSLSVLDSTIGDSLRAAAENITISGVTIDNNVTTASRSLEMNNVTCNAIYAVAQNSVLNVVTNDITISGENVTISGAISGNVNVDADNVTIKEGTEILGTLTVQSPNQPVIENNTNVANIDFNQVVDNSQSPTDLVVSTLIDIAYWTAVTAIIGFIIILCLNKTTERMGSLLHYHPVALILCGIVGVLIIPVIAIVLIFGYITTPLTFIITIGYFFLISICVPFAAVGISKCFMPKINPWLSGLIFTLLFGILSRIPYINFIVLLISAIVTFGYCLLAAYYNIKDLFHSEENIA